METSALKMYTAVPEDMSFEEAIVIGFCTCDAALRLELEEVSIGKKKSHVVVMVKPIASVRVDGESCVAPLMETESGEVKLLELTDDSFSLTVEWRDFEQGRRFVRSYQVAGSITVTAV